MADKILDPFSPEALRVDQTFAQGAAVKKLLTTIPVRKPPKQDFVRVNPDPDYRLPSAAVIELKDDSGEVYLVAPAIVGPPRGVQGGHHLHGRYPAGRRVLVASLWTGARRQA